MPKVQEIFRWYRDLPKVPASFTTIQQEEWKRENVTLLNHSFIGQKVTTCPAHIFDIGHDKISASATYHLEHFEGRQHRLRSDQKHQSNLAKKYASISYEILYDNSEFYNIVKSIHKGEMIEIEGIIRQVSFTTGREYFESDYYLSIQLSLTSLNKTSNRFLHAELLDENLRYKPALSEKFCFIATACYGNYDAPEVLILRRFRDDKLLNTSFGRMFVKFYYSVSPFFAQLISKSDFLKKLVRRYFLEPIVTKLQRQNKMKDE